MKQKTTAYISITIIYVILLLYISLSPLPQASATGQIVHNLLHIPAYGVLAYLILCCFSVMVLKVYAISFLLSFGFGSLIEFLQIFTPGRTASLMDVMLNSIGILACFTYVYWSQKIKLRINIFPIKKQ